MPTDRQVIVQLGFDSIITPNALKLAIKSVGRGVYSEIVEVHQGSGSGLATFRYADVRRLKAAFSPLTAQSRVYLQGHGDWASQKLESYDADGSSWNLHLANSKYRYYWNNGGTRRSLLY